MKKYVASFLAGALFVLSTTAFANDIKSLVGKKIQGEAVVELNGQALDNAIIVDGKSYAPVRVIGEAAGYDVSMQNKKIILDEKPSATVTTPGKGQSVEDQKAKLEERISDAVLRISDTNKLIEASEYAIKNSPDSGEEEVLKVRKNQLAEQQTLLADLKAQLAALN
ncbi:hypothetical protein QP794_27220 [Paenibacillus sp. UMB7766-LJ446]|uniref:hypothetical protein n=1 Tax=Paenibacillus sp. UMB7766-LJ446 TaxID=3046313 RepID=UPI002550D429|nr:hypothetical protein [Paenibacillus sp. UMB7766-LJ446]MDK8193778.1 hypothetical protein [Paenibacillus sp. UMB7766-LJ446]